VAWGALIGAAASWIGSAAGTVVRAAASPAGQAVLKGVLDVGVGIAGGLLQGGLSNPNAVGRRPQITAYAGPTQAALGAPGFIPGRSFGTLGDVGGGPQMALLGAPVLTAARTALGAIAARAGQVLTGTTARGVAGGALGAAAVEAFSGGGAVGMPGGLFAAGMPRARPIRRIIQQNPVTGQLAVWEYAGTPILFSRDLAVARRVARIMGRPGPRRAGRSRRFR
jgi:hypothetical protein